jgi:hypothetical protein
LAGSQEHISRVRIIESVTASVVAAVALGALGVAWSSMGGSRPQATPDLPTPLAMSSQSIDRSTLSQTSNPSAVVETSSGATPAGPTPEPTTVAAPKTPATANGNGAGKVTLMIDFGTNGKVGVDTYGSPMAFGWTSRAYDNNGDLESGCYVHWTLYDATTGANLYSFRYICKSNPLSGKNLYPGKYTFVGVLTTDDGRTTTGSRAFSVVNRGG